MIYTCFRCGTQQSREETQPSDKIKGISIEASRQFRMCKNCKCRTFKINQEKPCNLK